MILSESIKAAVKAGASSAAYNDTFTTRMGGFLDAGLSYRNKFDSLASLSSIKADFKKHQAQAQAIAPLIAALGQGQVSGPKARALQKEFGFYHKLIDEICVLSAITRSGRSQIHKALSERFKDLTAAYKGYQAAHKVVASKDFFGSVAELDKHLSKLQDAAESYLRELRPFTPKTKGTNVLVESSKASWFQAKANSLRLLCTTLVARTPVNTYLNAAVRAAFDLSMSGLGLVTDSSGSRFYYKLTQTVVAGLTHLAESIKDSRASIQRRLVQFAGPLENYDFAPGYPSSASQETASPALDLATQTLRNDLKAIEAETAKNIPASIKSTWQIVTGGVVPIFERQDSAAKQTGSQARRPVAANFGSSRSLKTLKIPHLRLDDYLVLRKQHLLVLDKNAIAKKIGDYNARANVKRKLAVTEVVVRTFATAALRQAHEDGGLEYDLVAENWIDNPKGKGKQHLIIYWIMLADTHRRLQQLGWPKLRTWSLAMSNASLKALRSDLLEDE